jgi:hypothetical protein
MPRRTANWRSLRWIKRKLQASLYYARKDRLIRASGGELLLETGEFLALENGQHLLLE